MYTKNNTNIKIYLINFIYLLFNIISKNYLIPPLTLFYIQIIHYNLKKTITTHKPLKKYHIISQNHKPNTIKNNFTTLN